MLMAPESNSIPIGSHEREFDSSCNCFFFRFFRARGIRDFWWASGGSIILHLVCGSRVPNGIISGWGHVRELGIVCLPAFSYGEVLPEISQVPSGELYPN